jgi:hypothetical protein
LTDRLSIFQDLSEEVQSLLGSESIFISVITGCIIDHTECAENTHALPQEISTFILRRLMGEKNRLKAERARFLSAGEESKA